MRIVEIEQKFADKDTLVEVILDLEEEFDKVDEYASKMKANEFDNPEAVKRGLNELTGVYSNLKTVLSLAEIEKKNREVRKFNAVKRAIEEDPKYDSKGKLLNKFVAASGDKEAREYVNEYSRVRNLIDGYTDACHKMMSTLQSLLKYMVVDWHNTQGE